MNTSPTPPPTALDELLRLVPEIDPQVLATARQAAELFRKLGLMSTEPTQVLSPFIRRVPAASEPRPIGSWAATPGVEFDKVRS